MSDLPRLCAEGRGRRFALVLALGLAQAALLAVVAIATRHAFTALHAGQPISGGVLAGLTAGGAGALVNLWASVQAERLGQSYGLSLRRTLYRHIAGMDPQALARRTLGGLSLRFVGDLSAAQGWFGGGLAQGLAALIVLPGGVAAMFFLSPPLAWATLLPLGLAAALTLACAAGLGPRHQRLRRRRSRIASSMVERIALAPALDLAGRTPRELARLDAQGAALVDDAAARRARVGLLRALPAIGMAIAGAAVVWTASARATPAAEVAAVLAALSLLHAPLRDLAAMWDRRCAWQAARLRCQALLRLPSQPRRIRPRGAAVPVQITGFDTSTGPLSARIGSSQIGIIRAAPDDALAVARRLAGLSGSAGVTYDGAPDLPRIALVAEAAPILRGSLRRNLALGGGPRPGGRELRARAREFGLETILARHGGLRGQIAEGGRDLPSDASLSLQLARAALTGPDLIVLHHPALRPEDPRLSALHRRTGATIVVIDAAGMSAGGGGANHRDATAPAPAKATGDP